MAAARTTGRCRRVGEFRSPFYVLIELAFDEALAELRGDKTHELSGPVARKAINSSRLNQSFSRSSLRPPAAGPRRAEARATGRSAARIRIKTFARELHFNTNTLCLLVCPRPARFPSAHLNAQKRARGQVRAIDLSLRSPNDRSIGNAGGQFGPHGRSKEMARRSSRTLWPLGGRAAPAQRATWSHSASPCFSSGAAPLAARRAAEFK